MDSSNFQQLLDTAAMLMEEENALRTDEQVPHAGNFEEVNASEHVNPGNKSEGAMESAPLTEFFKRERSALETPDKRSESNVLELSSVSFSNVKCSTPKKERTEMHYTLDQQTSHGSTIGSTEYSTDLSVTGGAIALDLRTDKKCDYSSLNYSVSSVHSRSALNDTGNRSVYNDPREFLPTSRHCRSQTRHGIHNKRKHISNLSNASIQSDHTYSRKLTRNFLSSSSQSSHAATMHRGGVHGDGDIKTGSGHHDAQNPLTSPSNSSGQSHAAAMHRSGAYGDVKNRNILSSSSQSSHAATMHRGGVHGDGNIKDGPGHHDPPNTLTSPSNSSGQSHAAAMHRGGAHGDVENRNILSSSSQSSNAATMHRAGVHGDGDIKTGSEHHDPPNTLTSPSNSSGQSHAAAMYRGGVLGDVKNRNILSSSSQSSHTATMHRGGVHGDGYIKDGPGHHDPPNTLTSPSNSSGQSHAAAMHRGGAHGDVENRNILSSSSQSSNAATMHRAGVHGDGDIKTGSEHHDAPNPLTSPSNSSGLTHAAAIHRGIAHGDVKTLPGPSQPELIVDDVPSHGHDLDNEKNSESEFGDLDEDGGEVCVGNNTEMNEFDMTEYFEKFRNQGLLSDDEEYVAGTDNSNPTHDASSSEKLPGDLGFQEMVEPEAARCKGISRRKINQIAKTKGQSYVRADGTVVPARAVKPACSCTKLKCNEKYTNDLRCELLKNMLQLTASGQNQFLSNHMALRTTARPTVLNSRRLFTRSYYLPAVNGRVRVCKEMFMATFDVKDKKLRVLANKQLKGLGISADDMRAQNSSRRSISNEQRNYIINHIRSFPSYTSHYSREKTSRLYLSSDLNVMKMYNLYKAKCDKDKFHPVHFNTYRLLFRSMKLAFRKPKADTCCTCDKLAVQLKQAETSAEKEVIQRTRDEHHAVAQAAYTCKKVDVLAAKTSIEVRTVSFDLQKCLPTPHLLCGTAFYKRQLYTLNLTVYSTSNGENSVECYLWDESKAKRGSQEIGSCILKDLSNTDQRVKVINYYSDRCAGQNHNLVMCMMFSHFIEKCGIQGRELTICHKFMTSGHSHMEVDSAHACIEKAKKRCTTNIETPRDWAVFISSIQRRVPFQVTEMDQKEFLALKQLEHFYKRPKFNTNGEPVRFKNISHFEYRTSTPGIVHYKYDLLAEDFMKFDMTDRDIKDVVLAPISNEPLPLSNEKMEDLKSLMDFVTNKAYYTTLLQQLVPKKRGRKAKVDVVDHFEADLDVSLIIGE